MLLQSMRCLAGGVALAEFDAGQCFLLDDQVVVLHTLAPLFVFDHFPVEGVVGVADVLAHVHRLVRLLTLLALHRLFPHALLYVY